MLLFRWNYPLNKADSMELLPLLETRFSSLSNPTPQAIKSCIENLEITWYDVFPFLESPDNKPYGRRLLYQSPYIECLLMNWAPYGKCNIHNHGVSWGFVQIITGEVVNIIYNHLLEPVTRITETTGNIFFTSKGIIHQMENLTKQPLVTLHIYCPPISEMKVYDLQHQQEIIVTDDCGAWVPDKNQIINSSKLTLNTNYCLI